MRLAGDCPSRLARLVFAGLMTFAWCGGVRSAVAQPAANPAVAGPAVDPKAIVALLKRLHATAEQELRKPGADPSDVPAKAAALGFDVERAFAFVRDEVAYEPYRGKLRGARGALAARAGNALDKSLLLKELLETGGHKARLMRGKLPSDQAKALVDAYLAKAPAAPAAVEPEIPQELAEQIGLTMPDWKELIAENRRSGEQFLADATKAADVEAAFLRQQLDAGGVKLGRSHDEWVAELTSRAEDHAWVEVIGADGASTALDPIIAGAKSGAAPAAAEAKPAADLSAERHVVKFQFVYATKSGDQSAEQVLMDVPLYADEALYDPPSFSIEPVDPLPPVDKILDMPADAVIKLMTGFKNYQAVMRVGGKRMASPAFDLKGNVTQIAADGRLRGAGQVGAATGGLFGGGLGGGLGGGGGEAKDANNFVSMGVVITIQSPGAEPSVQRRTLLTQAQTTGKEFLSPIVEWKMLVQPQQLSPELVGYESLQSTVRALGAVLPLMEAAKPDAATLNRVAASPASPYPSLLVDLATFARAALGASVAKNPALRVLWDRPQVSIQERRFCANASEKRTCSHAGIDIVDNGLSVLPATADASSTAAAVALWQGVFETVAESMIVARGLADGTTSAIGALRGARESGGLVLAAPTDAAALGATSLSDADRAWIARHERADGRVLATKSGAAAWWSVDPATGRTLGRRDGGRGQAFHEYAVQVAGGAVCMLITGVNYRRDNDPSEKKRDAFTIAMVGCVIGAGIAGSGVGASAVVQSTLTVIGIIIGGGLSFWSAETGR